MRKGLRITLIVILVAALGAIAYIAILNFPVSTIVIPSRPGGQQPDGPSAQLPILDVGEPLTLEIPSLGVAPAHIQQVGITAAGNMATPSGVNKYRDVAWYKLGPRPGQEGSSVIAGHLDNGLGLDAVFANLEKLVPGDEVIIKTKNNETLTFRVLGQEIYDYKEAPNERIFTFNDGRALLNLITCDGTWIQSEKSYDKRLIVYTELVSAQ